MAHVLPKYLTKWTTEKLKKEGVNVINNAEVTQVEMKNNRVLLHVNNGQQQVKKCYITRFNHSNIIATHKIITVLARSYNFEASSIKVLDFVISKNEIKLSEISNK